MKFIMAIVVVAIHTEPFHSSQHNMQIAFNTFSGLAVPFFFISSGFLLGRRMQGDSDILPAKKQLIKIIKLYVKWSVIYLPLAIKHIYQSMRSMSTIIYLIHMWVWTAVYTVIYHEKTFGLLCFMGTAGISIFIAFVYEKNVVTKH